MLVLLEDAPSAGSQGGDSITYEARPAGVAPPPKAKLPALRAKKKVSGTKYRPLAWQPVCPKGQIPVVQELAPEVMKGNPLLKPEANGQMVGTESHLPCDGMPNFGVCYYYANATYRRGAGGGGMIMTVARPEYVEIGGSRHSVNEIAVQGGARNGNIVELGWRVSELCPDRDPHLFVFHWIDLTPTCYDGCGWQQWSGTYFPGMNLSVAVGREVYVGYVLWQGN